MNLLSKAILPLISLLTGILILVFYDANSGWFMYLPAGGVIGLVLVIVGTLYLVKSLLVSKLPNIKQGSQSTLAILLILSFAIATVTLLGMTLFEDDIKLYRSASGERFISAKGLSFIVPDGWEAIESTDYIVVGPKGFKYEAQKSQDKTYIFPDLAGESEVVTLTISSLGLGEVKGRVKDENKVADLKLDGVNATRHYSEEADVYQTTAVFNNYRLLISASTNESTPAEEVLDELTQIEQTFGWQ